jgi:hypothetical protein
MDIFSFIGHGGNDFHSCGFKSVLEEIAFHGRNGAKQTKPVLALGLGIGNG